MGEWARSSKGIGIEAGKVLESEDADERECEGKDRGDDDNRNEGKGK